MIEKSKSNLPKIGYLYHHPDPYHLSEKFRLEIFVSSTPTEQHFDVLRANFFVKTTQEKIDRLTITHPWNYERSARVCAGVVVMEDRKGKKEEAFTFGGKLQIDSQESQTVCNLVSSAPILEISGATPLHGFFIEEIEVVLAEHQARYSDLQEYEKQKCKIAPDKLYLACLEELIEKFESFQQKDEKYHQLLLFLHSQKKRLAEVALLEEPLPTLRKLFE